MLTNYDSQGTFTKTEKSTNKTFTYLTVSELNRMKSQILPTEGDENKKQREEELHQLSRQKVQKWPDSIELVKKSQFEARKKNFFEEEIKRRVLDEEETKYLEREKRAVNENAAKMLFAGQDVVKSFKSGILLTDVLKEREYQKEIKRKKDEISKDIEQHWNEVEKEKMKAYDQKEKKKREEEKQIRNEQMAMISKQFGENKIKKIREYQDYIVEGEIIKKNAREAIEEEK